MAAMAGLSQPFELRTSTQAWIKRIALPRMVWKKEGFQSDVISKRFKLNMIFKRVWTKITSVSCCNSAESCIRLMCACSSKFAFTWGSLNFED